MDINLIKYYSDKNSLDSISITELENFIRLNPLDMMAKILLSNKMESNDEQELMLFTNDRTFVHYLKSDEQTIPSISQHNPSLFTVEKGLVVTPELVFIDEKPMQETSAKRMIELPTELQQILPQETKTDSIIEGSIENPIDTEIKLVDNFSITDEAQDAVLKDAQSTNHDLPFEDENFLKSKENNKSKKKNKKRTKNSKKKRIGRISQKIYQKNFNNNLGFIGRSSCITRTFR